MVSKLAIIIPAYKGDFLKNALQSIADQTCKDFTLYIGDDCSPDDLYSIIQEFENQIDIVFHRFDRNLGGTDLVGQWNRCLDLVKNENWCWLFSDDDVMESNCVERFFIAIKEYSSSKLFHFNIKIIDENDVITKQPSPFPSILDVPTFHMKKWKSQISSYVVEYIFEREYFSKMGGFQPFKFAWHTDEATWTKLAHPAGLITIDDAFVRWRRSAVNITPNNRDKNIVEGKLNADIDFAQWVVKFYKRNNLILGHTQRFLLAKRFIVHLVNSKNAIAKSDGLIYLKNELKALNISYRKPLFYLYYSYRLFKSKAN